MCLFRLQLGDLAETGQFSIIDVRPLHGMNDLCQRYGFKVLAYGVLVSISFTSTRSLHLDVDVGSSAADFSPTGGSASRSQSYTRAS